MAWEEGYLRGDVDGLIPGRKPGLDEKAMRKLILSEKASHWGGNNADVDRREDGDTKGWWASALDVDWIAGEAARGSGGGGKGREGEQYVCKRSFNAGRYLCEYIYYTSLRVAVSRRPPQGTVNKHKHKSHHHGPEETSNTTKRVLFLHVPQFGKPYELEDGQEIVKRIVKAMVIDGEGLRRKG